LADVSVAATSDLRHEISLGIRHGALIARSDVMTRTDRGFTLVEALVGLAFASVLTAGLANLVVVATGLTQDARDDTKASVLAVQKLEQLRSSIAAGMSVPLSPMDTLDEDVPGFSDRPETYVRRWRVSPLPSDVSSRRLLQVRVLAARRIADVRAASSSRARVPGEAILTTIAR
jgi:type II secretory pathway pseudopilin PulG